MSASQRVQREFGRCGTRVRSGRRLERTGRSHRRGSWASLGSRLHRPLRMSSRCGAAGQCCLHRRVSGVDRRRSSSVGNHRSRAALVAEPARTPSGYRDYEPAICERVTFIRHAQTAGFTLEQIRQVLEISDSGDAPCEHVAALITDRLSDVDARTAELTQARRHLERLARRAAKQDPADCDGFCSILVPRTEAE